MKPVLPLFLFLLFACNNKATPETSLYQKDYFPSHLDWVKVSEGSKDFSFGYEGIQAPMHVAWTTYKDSTGCLHIGSIAIVRKEGPGGITIDNIRDGDIPCGSVWESDDTTRFSQRIYNVHYEARKGKAYEYNGDMFRLNGKGEITVRELKVE